MSEELREKAIGASVDQWGNKKAHYTEIGMRNFAAAATPSVILALLDERDSLLTANEGMRKALEWAKSRFDAISIDCQGASICGEPEMGLEAIYHRASDARREIDAALSPALNSKLAPAGEGEANG